VWRCRLTVHPVPDQCWWLLLLLCFHAQPHPYNNRDANRLSLWLECKLRATVLSSIMRHQRFALAYHGSLGSSMYARGVAHHALYHALMFSLLHCTRRASPPLLPQCAMRTPCQRATSGATASSSAQSSKVCGGLPSLTALHYTCIRTVAICLVCLLSHRLQCLLPAIAAGVC
jgi:hypothetical protein